MAEIVMIGGDLLLYSRVETQPEPEARPSLGERNAFMREGEIGADAREHHHGQKQNREGANPPD